MARRWLLVITLLARAAWAADDPARVAEARKLFIDGAELVKRAQWSEALAAFEQSARLRPHAITTYNIGACQRAMGRYARARETFGRALAESSAANNQLPESLADEARGFAAELDGLLARVDLSVDPPEAQVAVDGRPLQVTGGDARPGRFRLVIDPGVHVFMLARKGFKDVVLNKTFEPGARTTLELKLDSLPATVHVSSTREGAIVTVDGRDVGAAPVDVQRPAGSYLVGVSKPGFLDYSTHLTVSAGEEASLRAPLVPKKIPIYKKWWFWTAAAVVLAGASVGTYFAARAAETPALDGGGLGWAVKLR